MSHLLLATVGGLRCCLLDANATVWQAALKALQDVMDLAGVSLGDHAGAVFDIMVAKGSTAKDSGGEEWMRCGRRIMRVSE